MYLEQRVRDIRKEFEKKLWTSRRLLKLKNPSKNECQTCISEPSTQRGLLEGGASSRRDYQNYEMDIP